MWKKFRSLPPYGNFEAVVTILISTVVRFVLSHVVSPAWERFSPRNILLWPTRIDAWERYSAVVRHLVSLDFSLTGGHILEVGAGGGGIVEAFLGIEQYLGVELLLTDIDCGRLRGRRNSVIANSACLPFRTSSFDVIICVDVLEHLQIEMRHKAIEELKRVTKGALIIHVPCDSEDGEYAASVDDGWLQITLKRILDARDPNIEEHLRLGPVMIESLVQQLPDSSVFAIQQSEVWRKHSLLSRLPYIRLLSGLAYYLLWRTHTNGGASHSALLVWYKDAEKENVTKV